MANKTTFTTDEWTKIMESVMLTGMAVTAADPSGLIGVLKESMATGRNLLAAKSDPESNELVRAVATDFATSEGRHAAREGLRATLQGSKARDVAAKSIAKLREIVSLVDQKAPDDAAGFKTWLQHIAVGAAEAASEGGFLGFGGVQVSDAEKATLKELSSALGVETAGQPSSASGTTKTATSPPPPATGAGAPSKTASSQTTAPSPAGTTGQPGKSQPGKSQPGKTGGPAPSKG